jgi:hypothetical protein
MKKLTRDGKIYLNLDAKRVFLIVDDVKGALLVVRLRGQAVDILFFGVNILKISISR